MNDRGGATENRKSGRAVERHSTPPKEAGGRHNATRRRKVLRTLRKVPKGKPFRPQPDSRYTERPESPKAALATSGAIKRPQPHERSPLPWPMAPGPPASCARTSCTVSRQAADRDRRSRWPSRLQHGEKHQPTSQADCNRFLDKASGSAATCHTTSSNARAMPRPKCRRERSESRRAGAKRTPSLHRSQRRPRAHSLLVPLDPR